MKPERWQQLDELFHAALQHEPEERAAFLDEACVDDEALRQQVEALLAANEEAGSFIESPAMEVEARGVAADQGSAEAGMASGETISHYRIISPLGSGGMGDVYLALDVTLSRKVALKLLPAEFTRDADRVRRFQQEARAASALSHPHSAHIYEVGEAAGRYFIVMEYVEGVPLGARINGHPLPVSDIVQLGIQIADAVAEAHAKGITHRDLKPGNIMVTPRGQAKLLDFGLAKIREAIDLDAGEPQERHDALDMGVDDIELVRTLEHLRGEDVPGAKLRGACLGFICASYRPGGLRYRRSATAFQYRRIAAM